MATEHDELRAALERVQAQLDEMRKLDPQVAAHLDTTISQAKAVLDSRQEDQQPESLADRFKDAVLEYEATHPTLAGNLGSVIDALGRMGI